MDAAKTANNTTGGGGKKKTVDDRHQENMAVQKELVQNFKNEGSVSNRVRCFNIRELGTPCCI